MKTKFLFPHKWRTTGIVLITIGIIAHVLHQGNFESIENWIMLHKSFIGINTDILFNDIEYLSCVIGLLLIGFSKEKIEDEQIAQLRSDSLQWAIYINYGIFILCTIFINGSDYLGVIEYNVLTPLIFFIVRFRWKIYQLNSSLKRQEEFA